MYQGSFKTYFQLMCTFLRFLIFDILCTIVVLSIVFQKDCSTPTSYSLLDISAGETLAYSRDSAASTPIAVLKPHCGQPIRGTWQCGKDTPRLLIRIADITEYHNLRLLREHEKLEINT